MSDYPYKCFRPWKERHTRELLATLREWRRSYNADLKAGTNLEELLSLERGIEEIKAVLATREHVPNKVEARKIRQDAARHGRKPKETP